MAKKSSAPAGSRVLSRLKRSLVAHPFLAAAYPHLFLYAHNITETAFETALAPLVISVLVAGVLQLLLSLLVLKDGRKAGIVVTLSVLLFYYFAPLAGPIEEYITFVGMSFWSPRNLVIMSLVIIAIAALLLHRSEHQMIVPTRFLNLAGIALLAMPMLTVGSYLSSGESGQAPSKPSVKGAETIGADTELSACLAEPTGKAKSEPGRATAGEPPDIYYIVLDGYPGASSLSEFSGIDNSGFEKYLKSKGFVLPEDARTNYFLTYLSIASSLNMEYLDFLTERVGKGSEDRRLAYKMIYDNRLERFLKGQGYKLVRFSSGWRATDTAPNADMLIESSQLNEFSTALLRSSMAWPYIQKSVIAAGKRATILTAFERLKTMPEDEPSPKFVFAHLVTPHPPYLLGSRGKKLPQGVLGDYIPAWRDHKAFDDEVKALNAELRPVIDAILAGSRRPPVIVIQGDHGSLGSTSFQDPGPGLYRERSSILNAIHLPTTDDADLDAGRDANAAEVAGMTPVNTFRMVLGRYFGTDCPMLKDSVEFSKYQTPYDFSDVTEQIESTTAE